MDKDILLMVLIVVGCFCIVYLIVLDSETVSVVSCPDCVCKDEVNVRCDNPLVRNESGTLYYYCDIDDIEVLE